jgi:hypothetical protein
MATGDSKESAQVHSRIERGDFRVTVEHQCLALEQFAQPPLPRLTPARMIDCRIHVRIETILLRCQLIPGRFRLPLRELQRREGKERRGRV